MCDSAESFIEGYAGDLTQVLPLKTKFRVNIALDEGAIMPTRAHEADAGLDLYSPQDYTLFKGDRLTIDTGVHMEIPEGYVGMVKSKSGMFKNEGIATEGVVDSGYTGTILVTLENRASSVKHFDRGDKIAQLVILPIVTPELHTVDISLFKKTERGTRGFGSTGK